jgi:hypothetical protein
VERAKSSAKLINLSNAFNINGSSMIPDAIVFESITHKIKDKKTYKVSANYWDDYGYKTSIEGIYINRRVRVGYTNQTTGNHTLNKLRELYNVDKNSGDVIINAPLPQNFCSFWEIDFSLAPEDIHKMYYFNHLFYIAIKNQITDFDIFITKCNKSQVFQSSVFRYKNTADLKKKFNDFIQLFFNQYEIYFEIIDIKYLDTKYFRDTNKIEEIKRRSIRKQFVYEHLLQKTLEKRKDQYSNLSIRSSFWLPSYLPDDSELLQDDSTFMDGYIKLKNVNFKLLAETYFA